MVKMFFWEFFQKLPYGSHMKKYSKSELQTSTSVRWKEPSKWFLDPERPAKGILEVWIIFLCLSVCHSFWEKRGKRCFVAHDMKPTKSHSMCLSLGHVHLATPCVLPWDFTDRQPGTSAISWAHEKLLMFHVKLIIFITFCIDNDANFACAKHQLRLHLVGS